MELVVKSVMDTIIIILNYQPLEGLVGIRIIHLILIYVCYNLWKSR